MKKLLKKLFVLWISLCLFNTTFAWDHYSYDSWYWDPILKETLNFKAYRDWYYVKTSWDNIEIDNFEYYKVIRSTTNDNPVYPEDWAIKYSANQNETSYIHKDYDSNYAYYRVCVITFSKDRYCSKVTKVEWYQKEYNSSSNTNYSSKNNYTKTSSLNTDAKEKAKKIVTNFITKLDKTDYTNEKKVTIINNIIIWLNSFKEKNTNSKELIDYLIQALEEEKSNYEDIFNEIENLFQID